MNRRIHFLTQTLSVLGHWHWLRKPCDLRSQSRLDILRGVGFDRSDSACSRAEPKLRLGMAEGNARMLALMRVLYFLGSWSPMGMLRTGTLFLLDRGMTVAQIGASEAATLCAPALINPLVGVVADRLRRRKDGVERHAGHVGPAVQHRARSRSS